MKLLVFSGKQRRFKPLLLRRIVGASMMPAFAPGQLVVASSIYGSLHGGDVVIVRREGKEIIKRIEQIRPDAVFIIGDNHAASTDSRSFGWVKNEDIVAKLLWPQH